MVKGASPRKTGPAPSSAARSSGGVDAGAGAVGHVVAGGMGAGAPSLRSRAARIGAGTGDLNSTRGTVGDEFVLC